MKRFRKIYIEITNSCNLRCSFCQKSSRERSFMTIESFRKVLKEIKPFTNYVYLHVKGEPLLHPQLELFLDECSLHDLSVVIVTNGTQIEKAGALLLEKSALRQINFSLHCYREIPLEQRHIYLSSIFYFAKEAVARTPMNISLRIWNLNKLKEINDNNQEILSSIQIFFDLSFSIKERLTDSNSVKLGERLYLNADYQFEWPGSEQSTEDPKGFCKALRDHVAILVDGTVVPCCLDGEGQMVLGNAFHQTFSDILNSSRADHIYQSFSNAFAIEKLCKKCTFKNRFDHSDR